jgi:hypothetical protein
VGTERPSVAEEQYGYEVVQWVGLAVEPAVKAPARHCRHIASEELCTQVNSDTVASTVPV